MNCKVVDQAFSRLQFLPALVIEKLDCLHGVPWHHGLGCTIGRSDLKVAGVAKQPHADPICWPWYRVTITWMAARFLAIFEQYPAFGRPSNLEVSLLVTTLVRNACYRNKFLHLSRETFRVWGHQDLAHGKLEVPGGFHWSTLGVRFESINLEAQQRAISVESGDHAHVIVPFIDQGLQREIVSSCVTRCQGWWQKGRTSIHDRDLLIGLNHLV